MKKLIIFAVIALLSMVITTPAQAQQPLGLYIEAYQITHSPCNVGPPFECRVELEAFPDHLNDIPFNYVRWFDWDIQTSKGVKCKQTGHDMPYRTRFTLRGDETTHLTCVSDIAGNYTIRVNARGIEDNFGNKVFTKLSHTSTQITVGP